MRIGIDITPLSNGQKTGIGMYVDRLLRAISEMDKKNHYFLLYGGEKGRENLPFYGSNFEVISFFRVKESLSYLFNLGRVIKKLELDIFHSTSTIGCPKKPSVPVISTVHDIFLIKQKNNYSLSGFFYKVMGRRLIRYSSYYLYNSEDTRNGFCHAYGIDKEQGAVTYLGTSFQSSSLAERTHECPIICVGAIEARKNQLFLANLYKKVLQLNKDLPDLIFIGPLRDKNIKFEETIKMQGSDKIKWVDYVSDEELRRYYATASLMLYPSISEGFGMPLVEAISCSLPVICSDIPVFREVGEGYPVFAEVNDEQDWMCKIISFYNSEYPDMSERSQRLMPKYSWESCAKKTIESYRKVSDCCD